MIARRRTGFTLIEIVVSFTILLIIALAIASAFLPMEQATTRSSLDLELDRTARRVLAELRREVRQSGQAGPTEKITIPADGTTVTTVAPPTAAAPVDLIVYSIRTGPDEVNDWRGPITLRAVPDGTFRNVPNNSVNRYRLERVENGQTVILCRNVSRVNVERPAGGRTLIFQLDLSTPDPQRVDPNTVPPPITQRHTDTIQFLNQ